MTVQELIDKLENLKKEFGNMEVVIRDPDSNPFIGNSVTSLNIWGGKVTGVCRGNWEYRAIKVDIYED